jgi:hypothetical protein
VVLAAEAVVDADCVVAAWVRACSMLAKRETPWLLPPDDSL